jgi:hypothetical protein
MTLGSNRLTAHHLKALPHHRIPMLIKLKVVLWMIWLFFKEIYELLTGKRKWT